MIWHVRAEGFIRFLTAEGSLWVAESDRHDIFERGAGRVQVRRSAALPQAEVDAICDAAELHPPPMQSFFGDRAAAAEPPWTAGHRRGPTRRLRRWAGPAVQGRAEAG